MPKSTDQSIHAVHQKALQRFNRISWATRDERDYMMSDRRFAFIAGAQWEGDLREQFENKPRFEVNKIRMSVMRIANEYRNNRMTVDFTPNDGTGKSGDKMADFLDGSYRAMEEDSVAVEAYDNGFDEAVNGGFGAIRFVTEYEDEFDPDNDQQVVRMEPVVDACRSVYFDLQSKRQDKSDARYCFVISSTTPEAYEYEYGATDFSSWPVDDTSTQFDWYTPDVVYVAEYFLIEKEDYKLYTYSADGADDRKHTDEDFESDPTLVDILAAEGYTLSATRKVKRQIVNKYVLSGAGMLEKPQKMAGKFLPIIPVYGQRAFIDNLERVCSHVRPAKDVQRLKNIQLSRLGEISILSPNEKPIFTPNQVKGHEKRWSDDNLKNFPYQLINATHDEAGNEIQMGPLAYTKPPNLPPALAALLQLTEQDMQDLLGNQQAGEVLQPNTSGDAVSLVQTRLDMQTAIYIDNMRKAVVRCGQVWLSMFKDIYVEEGRNVKVIGADGKNGSVELGKKVINDDGAVVPELDLEKVNYAVHVEVGPSSSSKRASVVKSIVGMMAVNNDEETGQVLLSTAIMNMEGEGLGDIRDFFRNKLLQMGAVKPTEEEAKMLQEAEANKQPDPQAAYLKAESELSMVKAQKTAAEADKVVAETEQISIEDRKLRAEIIEIMADIDREDAVKASEIMERLTPDAQSAPAQNGARRQSGQTG